MFKIQFTKTSEVQLFQIYQKLAEINAYTASQTILKIRGSTELLEMFPYSGAPIGDKYRYIVDTKDSFKLVYKIGCENIYIVGVFV